MSVSGLLSRATLEQESQHWPVLKVDVPRDPATTALLSEYAPKRAPKRRSRGHSIVNRLRRDAFCMPVTPGQPMSPSL